MHVTSRIDGEFTGTDNEKVYRLVNGQVWQQIGYRYRYKYRYRPRVTIDGSSSRALMVVDGFREPIRVRRLS
jgi:predicted metalloprotease